MTFICNNKKYDTNTAEPIIKTLTPSGGEEILYKKTTGEFFVVGQGEVSVYNQYAVDGFSIIEQANEYALVFEEGRVKRWAEQILSVVQYESIFGEVKE